jgi:hypothetical protein
MHWTDGGEFFSHMSTAGESASCSMRHATFVPSQLAWWNTRTPSEAQPAMLAEGGVDVERVARAIDPDDWKIIDLWGPNPEDDRAAVMRDQSMARANAAIAALALPTSGQSVEVAGLVEKLRERGYNQSLFNRDGPEAAAALKKMAERADKFMWQVRDTCKRAEAAEANLAREKADNARLREGLGGVLEGVRDFLLDCVPQEIRGIADDQIEAIDTALAAALTATSPVDHRTGSAPLAPFLELNWVHQIWRAAGWKFGPPVDRSEGREDMSDLISIADAAARGIERVRMTKWANDFDHFKIDIIDGEPGPWLHLYSPVNEVIGQSNPVDILWVAGPLKVDIHERCFVPFTGDQP